MELSDKEKLIITDRDFLIAKNNVIEKVQTLFEKTRLEQKHEVKISNIKFPSEIDISYGKIFRGENYRQLPYVVLEYPKLYSKNDVFTFRTMFWWGHLFSTTLHLEGKSLETNRSKIIKNISNQIDQDIYICVNDSPWEYHYGDDNYSLLTQENINLIENVKFIKLSKYYSLDEYNIIPDLSRNFLKTCLKLIT